MKLRALAFIVRHLAISRHSKGIVHVVSLIATIGVAVASFALVVVLSVFNGFTGVATGMFEKTCPPILITPSDGKIINEDVSKKINGKENIAHIIPIIQTTALLNIGDNRVVVQVLGIDSNYFLFNPIDTLIVSGKGDFIANDTMFLLLGINLAVELGLNKGTEKMGVPLYLTVPAKEQNSAIVKEDMIHTMAVIYSACYQTRTDLDDGTAFININRARELLSMRRNEVNKLYVLIKDPKKTDQTIKTLREQLGTKYKVQSILEQQPLYFRIIKNEKLAIYVILSLIIFIASINIVSTIILLHIQKQQMNDILRAMGVTLRDLRRIYFYYGMLINVVGCILGLIVGIIICIMQEKFGIVKLSANNFVVDAFPVRIFWQDIIIVIGIVLLVGMMAVRMVTTRLRMKK